ncbi:hypothetical protein VTL71DRAFT_1539 [Oculimacula yallundae]|uniref:Uncharacterized protein n=1 Tax=Oculimacula yallundae TaxID=86028 RepID=A0ABR4CB08_9HELO
MSPGSGRYSAAILKMRIAYLSEARYLSMYCHALAVSYSSIKRLAVLSLNYIKVHVYVAEISLFYLISYHTLKPTPARSTIQNLTTILL